jgi:hypothetical protein
MAPHRRLETVPRGEHGHPGPFREIILETRAGDVMACGGGAAGPAPDVRHQPAGDVQAEIRNNILIPCKTHLKHQHSWCSGLDSLAVCMRFRVRILDSCTFCQNVLYAHGPVPGPAGGRAAPARVVQGVRAAAAGRTAARARGGGGGGAAALRRAVRHGRCGPGGGFAIGRAAAGDAAGPHPRTTLLASAADPGRGIQGQRRLAGRARSLGGPGLGLDGPTQSQRAGRAGGSGASVALRRAARACAQVRERREGPRYSARPANTNSMARAESPDPDYGCPG